ncbi:hypothetical protein CEXT_93231 [Caerostris extrusa]|uniref:Uncharacterized protein n=1 Tax=Caerostris extrusa TaxID=172846 RepID=A0AAV4UXN9_CAEEX|nr:hypothetical protein CEXT_93231 [Caerostris extrusa]
MHFRIEFGTGTRTNSAVLQLHLASLGLQGFFTGIQLLRGSKVLRCELSWLAVATLYCYQPYRLHSLGGRCFDDQNLQGGSVGSCQLLSHQLCSSQFTMSGKRGDILCHVTLHPSIHLFSWFVLLALFLVCGTALSF